MITKVEQFIQVLESKIKDVEIDLLEFNKGEFNTILKTKLYAFNKGEFNTILKTRLYALNEILSLYKKLNDR